MNVLDRYSALCQQVGEFFSRVEAAHVEHIHCHTGCSECCHARLSITLVEAVAVFEHLQSLGEGSLAKLQARARAEAQGQCAALDAAGRCGIYAARPLVCRSHGVPVKIPDGAKRLAVVDVCPRNFTVSGSLENVVEADILDQETVSTVLAAVDAALADELGAPRGTRIDLAELIIDPTSVFEAP